MRAPTSASATTTSNQADRALQQFDYSLKLDPSHTKTLLNQGIVMAFGKQDLERRVGGVAEGRGHRAEQPRGSGRQARARGRGRGAPASKAARRLPEASPWLRWILLAILLIIIARLFWRVVDA